MATMSYQKNDEAEKVWYSLEKIHDVGLLKYVIEVREMYFELREILGTDIALLRNNYEKINNEIRKLEKKKNYDIERINLTIELRDKQLKLKSLENRKERLWEDVGNGVYSSKINQLKKSLSFLIKEIETRL